MLLLLLYKQAYCALSRFGKLSIKQSSHCQSSNKFEQWNPALSCWQTDMQPLTGTATHGKHSASAVTEAIRGENSANHTQLNHTPHCNHHTHGVTIHSVTMHSIPLHIRLGRDPGGSIQPVQQVTEQAQKGPPNRLWAFGPLCPSVTTSGCFCPRGSCYDLPA